MNFVIFRIRYQIPYTCTLAIMHGYTMLGIIGVAGMYEMGWTGKVDR